MTILETEKMKQAKVLIRDAKMPFRQPNPYQIKHGPFNFYPDKGTIFRDGDCYKLEERGIIPFMKLCGYPKDSVPFIELSTDD